jgi:nascent polypeptide-associated complex subunit alpha
MSNIQEELAALRSRKLTSKEAFKLKDACPMTTPASLEVTMQDHKSNLKRVDKPTPPSSGTVVIDLENSFYLKQTVQKKVDKQKKNEAKALLRSYGAKIEGAESKGGPSAALNSKWKKDESLHKTISNEVIGIVPSKGKDTTTMNEALNLSSQEYAADVQAENGTAVSGSEESSLKCEAAKPICNSSTEVIVAILLESASDDAVKIFSKSQDSLTGAKDTLANPPCRDDQLIDRSSESVLETRKGDDTVLRDIISVKSAPDAVLDVSAQESLIPCDQSRVNLDGSDINQLLASERVESPNASEAEQLDFLNATEVNEPLNLKEIEDVPEISTVKETHNESLEQKVKQNRNEKKSRKVMEKLGLVAVHGILRATFQAGRQGIFVIENPDVFTIHSTNKYVIFGEAKSSQRSEAAMAAKNFQTVTPGMSSETGKEVPIQVSMENSIDPVDDFGVDIKDVELLMSQSGCSKAKAVKCLKDNDGDLVNAIMALTE